MRRISAALVMAVLASLVPPVAAAEPAAAGLAESWRGPLSTRGRYIVDADGNRFKLRSGNWHGASGTWTGSGARDDPGQPPRR